LFVMVGSVLILSPWWHHPNESWIFPK